MGDTLDLTIDFAGLQQLTVTNLEVIFASIWTTNGQQGANITQTGTVSFLSASGSTIYTTPVNTTFDGTVHAGQYLGPNQGDLGPVPSTLTFGGVRYVGTVDAYTDGYTTRNYDTPVFYVHGASELCTLIRAARTRSFHMDHVTPWLRGRWRYVLSQVP